MLPQKDYHRMNSRKISSILRFSNDLKRSFNGVYIDFGSRGQLLKTHFLIELWALEYSSSFMALNVRFYVQQLVDSKCNMLMVINKVLLL